MTVKFSKRAAFLILFAALSLTPLVTAGAQVVGSDEGSIEEKTTPVCMARPRANVAQVQEEDRGRPVNVVVTPRSVPELEIRGFGIVECADAGFSKPQDFAAYRDRVCEFAASGNEAVQNQFERAFGEQPSILCANAEQYAGRWDRKQSRLKE
ncbi:MAG: hypothetical protein AAF494_05690 [Pseudomonadota bacterium]